MHSDYVGSFGLSSPFDRVETRGWNFHPGLLFKQSPSFFQGIFLRGHLIKHFLEGDCIELARLSFRNKSSLNEVNEYMEKISALAEIQPVLKNSVMEKKFQPALKNSWKKNKPIIGMEFQFGLKTELGASVVYFSETRSVKAATKEKRFQPGREFVT